MGDLYKVQIISLKEYGEIYPHITMDSNVYWLISDEISDSVVRSELLN